MSALGPVDPGVMRRLNTATTLRELHNRRTVTLTQLTDSTGLSRRTVELILDELVAEGQAFEAGAASGLRTVGRPARTFSFNAQHSYAMAVQIDEDSIDVLVCDIYGTALGSWTQSVTASTSRDERLRRVRDAVESVFRTLDVPTAKVKAVTVSTMGVVRDDGIVELKGAAGSSGPNVADWSGFSVADELADLFSCSVVVENDAKLAAIGEGWRGGARQAANHVYVLAEGRRVGVGVVINGKLYRGFEGQAGEIFWAQPVFGLGEVMTANPLLGLSSHQTDRGRAALGIVENAREGDEGALAVVADLAAGLAPGLHAIACLLSPEVLVVGGSLADIGSPLTEALEREFASRTSPDTRIALSELGSKAVLLGAMRESLDRIEAEMFTAG